MVLWNPRKADVRESSESQLFQVPGSEHAKLDQAVSNSILTASKGGESADCSTPSVFSHSYTKKVFYFYLYWISTFQSVPVTFCPVTGFSSYLEILALSSSSLSIEYFSTQLRLLSESSPVWTVPALLLLGLYCLFDFPLHSFQNVHRSPGDSPGLYPTLQEYLTRAG